MILRRISIFYTLIFLFLSTTFIACSDDNGGSPADIENGHLSGSVWVSKYESHTSITESEIEMTYSFTSDKAGKYTRKGYSRIKRNNKWQPTIHVDEEKEFTYIYAPTERAGVIYMKSGSELVFYIKQNYEQMTFLTSKNVYELQY